MKFEVLIYKDFFLIIVGGKIKLIFHVKHEYRKSIIFFDLTKRKKLSEKKDANNEEIKIKNIKLKVCTY
jgi:hypothetical protein